MHAGQEVLSSDQAREAAYRFVARYYDHERVVPILLLVEAISSGEHPAPSESGRAMWHDCVQATLDGAPLPDLPPPWDA
jgi:hypothetical protein